jgi:hypothetical protein
MSQALECIVSKRIRSVQKEMTCEKYENWGEFAIDIAMEELRKKLTKSL